MLESGIIMNGYELKAGREYLHRVSNYAGNKNEKYKLTAAGKQAIKSIKQNTEYGSMKRVNAMADIWIDADRIYLKAEY